MPIRPRAVVRFVLFTFTLPACTGGAQPSGDDDAGPWSTEDAGNETPDEDAGPEGCADQDLDGFGSGPECDSDDCNDLVSEVHAPEECEAWCASHTLSPGCSCDGGEGTAPCYAGTNETDGVGACRRGASTCVESIRGLCEGQVLPTGETCNREDDDCNGAIDDGPGICGACPCREVCAGPDCGGWGDPLPSNTIETLEGWLTLEATSAALHVIWLSQTGIGEVYRVTTTTRGVEAAFWTGPNRTDGERVDLGDNPFASAVDDVGDFYVGNRAVNADTSSITKFAASSDTCPDSNGNGRVDTSTAWNDTRAFDSHEAWEDECILWHTPVGNYASTLALYGTPALDAPEMRGWLGVSEQQTYLEFDVSTGQLTGVEVSTPECRPDGAAIDRDGWLWSICLPTGIDSPRAGRFDTLDPAASFERIEIPAAHVGFFVIVDENNTPWMSGSDLLRWDRELEEFVAMGLTEEVARRFGLGNLASDGRGSIWLGSGLASGSTSVYRVRNGSTLEYSRIGTDIEPVGVAADFDGQVWGIEVDVSRVDPPDTTAVVIDLETGEADDALNDCEDRACLNYPFVRGDITGLQRRNAQLPKTRWTKVFEGCSEGETDWKRVTIDAARPSRTELVVWARTAETLAGVADADFVTAGRLSVEGPDLDLDPLFLDVLVADGRFLEVLVALEATDTEAPVLRRVDVQWQCETVD